jgi:hypothetical protein
LREFLHQKQVPVHIRRKVIAFMDNYYARKSVFEEKEILSNLPDSMRHELIHYMCASMLDLLPALYGPL